MVARRSRLGALAAAVMCAVALVLAAPTPALAANQASVTTSTGATTNYETLTSALSTANSGDTVTLLDNITITSNSTTTGYTVDKSITLDLGEKTISSSVEAPLTISAAVTLKNGTVEMTAWSGVAIVVKGSSAKLVIGADAIVKGSGNLAGGISVESGAFEMTGGTITATASGVTLASGVTASITGGTITAYWPVNINGQTGFISGVISNGSVTSKPTFKFTTTFYNEDNNPYKHLKVAENWLLVDESGNAIATTGEVTNAVTATVAYTGTLATDISNFTLSQTASLTYTGSVLTPTYKLVDGSGDEVDSSKYDVTVYSDSACTSEVTEVKDAGTYYAKATAKANSGYTGTTAAANFTVGKKTVTLTTTGTSKTYDGGTLATGFLLNIDPASVADADKTEGAVDSDKLSVNYKTALYDNKNVGTGKTITANNVSLDGTSAANYQVDSTYTTTTGSITQKEITVTIANIADQTYTGSQITPTVSVSSNDLATGDTLTLGTDYTVSYGTNITAAQGGTVSVSPVDGSNYTFDTASATFNIIKANATTTTEPSATNPTYNGNAQALVSEGATSDGTLYYRLKTGDSTYTDWSTTVPTATNAGSYEVEWYIAGDANHNDSTAQTISASIAKASYSGTISGSLAVYTNTAATYTYDFASQVSGIDGVGIKSTENTSDPNYIIGGFDGNNTTVTVKTKSVSGEGKTATIRVGFESTNYNNFYAMLTLTTKNKGDAGVTISGAPASLTYGDADFTLTATATNAGANGAWTWTSSDPDTLQVTQDSTDPSKAVVKALAANTTGAAITVAYESDSTVGTATTATIPVNQKALTITGVSAADKTYDGTTDATITGTAALSGVLTGDTVSLDSTNASASFEDKNAGTGKTVTFSGYTLTGADEANYTLTQPTATATISPKEITPVWDTSYAYTKTYDGTKAAGSVAQLDVPSGAACTGETLMLAGDSSTTYQFNSENVSEANEISVSVQLLIDESSSGTPSYNTTDNYVLAGYEGTVTVGGTTYYTYTHTGSITKAASSLTTAPAAVSGLAYTGSAQELVTAGSASGGSVVYRYKLSTASDWSDWSTELPAAMNAGTYDIEYKVVGDANHNDTTAQAISATISPSGTAPNAPSEYNPSYTVTTLAGVDLPDGWEWVDSSTALAVGEAVTAKAKYVGEDAGNYATTEVDVKVTRSACTHPDDKQETRNAKDATCTDAGYTGDTYCTQCETTIAKGSEIPALGHLFTNYVSNGDATCTEDGTKTAACDRGCGATDTVVDAGSALGHDYAATVTEPTCTEGGYTTYVCSRCKDTYTGDETAALGHSFTTYTSNGDATCTADGTKTATCDRGCGATDTITDEGSALGHDYAATVTEPTCTDGGYTTYVCSRCQDTYVDNETAALGHDWASEWSSDESSHWHACERCGEKADVAAHDLAWEGDANGHKQVCGICGYTTEVAAHSFEWVVDKEATATEAGSKHEQCSVCGFAKAAVEIPATGSGNTGTPESGTTAPAATPKLAATGDTAAPLAAAALALAGAALAAAVFAARRRKDL